MQRTMETWSQIPPNLWPSFFQIKDTESIRMCHFMVKKVFTPWFVLVRSFWPPWFYGHKRPVLAWHAIHMKCTQNKRRVVVALVSPISPFDSPWMRVVPHWPDCTYDMHGQKFPCPWTRLPPLVLLLLYLYSVCDVEPEIYNMPRFPYQVQGCPQLLK